MDILNRFLTLRRPSQTYTRITRSESYEFLYIYISSTYDLRFISVSLLNAVNKCQRVWFPHHRGRCNHYDLQSAVGSRGAMFAGTMGIRNAMLIVLYEFHVSGLSSPLESLGIPSVPHSVAFAWFREISRLNILICLCHTCWRRKTKRNT